MSTIIYLSHMTYTSGHVYKLMHILDYNIYIYMSTIIYPSYRHLHTNKCIRLRNILNYKIYMSTVIYLSYMAYTSEYVHKIKKYTQL